MVIKRWIHVAGIISICIGLSAGCKTSRPDEDVLTPVDVVQGDYPLDGFVEDLGTRVTDPDAQFDNVLFSFDSSQIAASERPKIEAVARYLRSHSGTRAVLEGHCDERGDLGYNMALGERRALAARAYMIRLGIDTARIFTRSYGEEKPLDPSHNERAWRVNRRVQFVIYK